MKVFMIQSATFSFKDLVLFYSHFLKIQITLAQSQHIHTSRNAPFCTMYFALSKGRAHFTKETLCSHRKSLPSAVSVKLDLLFF